MSRRIGRDLAAAPAVLAVVTAVAASLAAPPVARAGTIDPSVATVNEKLGAQVPLDLELVDETGKAVKLGDYFGDGKPVLLVLAYFTCPQLCGLIMQGAATALRQTGWAPGEQYRVVTVSFDAHDKPEDARQKQAIELAALGVEGQTTKWPFLTGTPDAILALTRSIGFGFARDDASGQYAHPAVLTFLSPQGRVSRYLYGISFPPGDVKLALLEASQGKTGSALDRVILRCYQYDPATRRYGLVVANVMRIGGVFILGAVGTLVGMLWRRERRKRVDR